MVYLGFLFCAGVFARWTGIDNVIGVIDRCHIRLHQPKRHGSDYVVGPQILCIDAHSRGT